ncbi:MAG: ATP-binding protein [Tissierellia bacterium]|nr:ATP-binding protein [Tissierellia bacterium]
MKTRKEIERALIKKYRRYLWTKFVKAINEYELIQDGDRIAVAISGGKDSLILAKLFQELYSHGYRNFELEFIAMDPGYAPEIRASHEKNLEYLGIPAHIYDADIFDIAGEIAKKNPCYMCARMRRGSLYAKAEELGCNKLALGHHLDDVIETILLNVLCAGSYKTMMPKLKADNFENMELIRPLYLIREESIIAWTKYSGLNPLDCACEVTKKEEGSMRKKIKNLIGELREDDFTNVEMNIFRSAENVEIDRVISYKKDGKKHHFLDDYDSIAEE